MPDTDPPAVVRPLTEADIEEARQVQVTAFTDYDRRMGEPAPELTPATHERQRRRLRHFLTHDPGGSWVADAAGRVVGVALALRRERLWGLSLLVVDPTTQSRGVGARLLAAALTHARPDDRGVILSSRDPRAMHRYAAAGFDLHPQVRGSGEVRRGALPALRGRVRLGGIADAPVADSVDAAVRGAPRGPDHALLADLYSPMFVADDADGRGYAYPLPGGGVHTLAATDEQTATDLLWRCLAHDVECGRSSSVDHVTGNQQWAVRVAVQAGLSLSPAGPVYWRGSAPPPAYLPSGPYL